MRADTPVLLRNGTSVEISACWILESLRGACDDVRVEDEQLRFRPRRPLDADFLYIIEDAEPELIALLEDEQAAVH